MIGKVSMTGDRCYKCEGYEQGFSDGKRSGGKINAKYVRNLLQEATRTCSPEEASLYEQGWQEGFSDAVNGILKNLVVHDSCLDADYLMKDPFEK